MSVIPLIPGKTVAYTQEGFEAGGGANGDSVLILNCEESQLNGLQHMVSYDLRVGSEYRDHRSGVRTQIGEGDEITLLPGTAVIIQTQEFVHFPRNAFGAIVPKVSLLQVGISNTTSKIDPGYHGPLVVTAFNLGRRTERLAFSAPFCCLYVLRVEDGAGLYAKGPKRIDDVRHSRFLTRALDFLESHSGVLSALLLIANLLLIALTILALLKARR